MDFKDKLQRIRKDLRLSQEDLAEKLDISRQAIAKWETGQAYPEIDNLIKLSNLFQITIDRLIKDNGNCEYSILKEVSHRGDDFVNFLCDAKKMTYAGKGIKENDQVERTQLNLNILTENIHIWTLTSEVKGLLEKRLYGKMVCQYGE